MTLDELKLNALKVVRNNATLLVIMALFPFCVGLRIHNGTLRPYTNWLTLALWAVLLPGLYFSMVLTVAMFQDGTDAASARAGNLAFGGAIGYELLLGIVLMLAVGLGAWQYRDRDPFTGTDILFYAAMVLLVLYSWPRPIRFAGSALVQRNIFGGIKSLAFADIAVAKFDARQRCILITGKNGARIVHSMLHARQAQFVRQLADLAGVRVSGLNG
ncbi:MAG: hypothetical protein WBQ34_01830 [Candidatus Acidiferrales bacterium]